MKGSGRPTEGFTVILSVIPPRTTPETRSDQIDGTANLTCKDGTCQHAIDGHEPTYDRSVAGSRRAATGGHTLDGRAVTRSRAGSGSEPLPALTPW